MATYYFDGDLWAGSKDGTGTSADPFNSLLPITDADITLANGDTLYLTGTFRPDQGSYLLLTNTDNLTIAQWPGQSRPQWRGDTIPETSDWTQGVNVGTDDNTYLYTVAEEPWAVAWNYDANLGTLTARETAIGCVPFHYGFLENAADLATCQATAGTWFWNGTTTLYVNPPAGAQAPDTPGDAYSVCWRSFASAADGIQPTNCDDITISGIDFWLYTGWINNSGYAVKCDSCARVQIVDCTAHEWGWHAFGGVGTGHAGSRIVNCIAYGGYQVSVNGNTFSSICNPYVFAHTTTSQGQITDFEFAGCEFFHHRARGVDQEPLADAGSTPMAFQAHGSTGSTIFDVRVVRPRVYCYTRDTTTGSPGTLAGGDNAVTAETAPDPANYAIRVFDGVVRAAGFESVGFGGNAAFERCVWDFDTSVGPPVLGGGVSSWSRYNASYITHLRFCSIVYRADTQTYSCLMTVTGTSAPIVRLEYCTVHNTGVNHANNRGAVVFEQGTGAFSMIFSRCVFSAVSTTGLIDSGTFTQVFFRAGSNADFLKFTFSNNAWYGYSATLLMATDGADITAATMQSTYDTAGQFRGQVNPGYVSVSGLNVSTPIGSDLRSLILDDDDYNGIKAINGGYYSGHYGSNQYGVGVRSRNSRPRGWFVR